MLRELHWIGIVFGTATGLVASYVLFVFSGYIGQNVIGQLVIQLIGFIVAGYVAGRFSLIHAFTAGRISALILFFVVATSTIASGAGANIAGLLLLSVLALGGGMGGAAIAERRRTV
jgi:hypothetical protein